MNQPCKILAATTAVVLGGLVAANSAGAAGVPWYCVVTNTAQACRIVETGRDIDRKANAAADAAATAAKAGEQGGRAVVNGVELAGTVAGKVADGLDAANRRAQDFEVPPRRLAAGECVSTSAGRYCAPAATSTTAAPYCVTTSSGVRWCVR